MIFLRRHFGTVLIGIALTALTLGTFGFLRCDSACSVATALYRGVQLFYWNYFPWNTTTEATLPWTLEVARWLAPIATLGALSRVAVALFQRRWDALRARRMRGHTVICGAGEIGMALANELYERGGQVVIIEKSQDRADAVAASGPVAIAGDATQADILRRAGVPAAARMVITTPGDHENLTIAMTAAHLASGHRRLSIHVHSSDASLCDLYQRNQAMAASIKDSVRVRVFNHYRDIARCTVQQYPPESSDGEAHVILPSLSRLGIALALEYALVGHFTSDRRVHLHVLGDAAIVDVAALKSRFPSLEQCLKVEAIDLRPVEKYSSRAGDLVMGAPVKDRFTIFAGFAEDPHAFAHALELLEATRKHSAVLVLLPHESAPSIRHMVEVNREMHGRVAFLPGPEQTCSYEAIIGEALDRTAQQVHENWLKETRQQIETARAEGDEALAGRHEAKATFKPWAELNEEQKGASRSQADHIPFKLRAVGLDPLTATAADWENLSQEQIETLARMEHARWAAYYWMTGWTNADERNDERKQHPNLVSYDELDDATRNYDRAAVRSVGEYLPRP